jgi:hypothetical protein
VYRRDSIDATHYPVFHQMEGVRVYAPADWEAAGLEPTAFAERELKGALEVGRGTGVGQGGRVWQPHGMCLRQVPTLWGMGGSQMCTAPA